MHNVPLLLLATRSVAVDGFTHVGAIKRLVTLALRLLFLALRRRVRRAARANLGHGTVVYAEVLSVVTAANLGALVGRLDGLSRNARMVRGSVEGLQELVSVGNALSRAHERDSTLHQFTCQPLHPEQCNPVQPRPQCGARIATIASNAAHPAAAPRR